MKKVVVSLWKDTRGTINTTEIMLIILTVVVLSIIIVTTFTGVLADLHSIVSSGIRDMSRGH